MFVSVRYEHLRTILYISLCRSRAVRTDHYPLFCNWQSVGER